MSSLTELIPPAGFQSLNHVERPGANQKSCYDIEEWRIDRFKGTPPSMKWLVQDYIPLGIAGALYSVGGAGKSTLALDLGLRIAIAPTLPTKWLGSFPVEYGGAVAYFSGEEPDDVLHRRVWGICAAIAEEEMTGEDKVFRAARENLYLSNLWGKVEPLFAITKTTLEPALEYGKIREALQSITAKSTLAGNPLRLIVIDTRSRFSGAEGAGNALVSREVALFEKLAHDFEATVLVLHHVNKASLYGGNAMAAARGESAFLDCLRFSIHVEPLSHDAAERNGISEEERVNHLVLTNSKQNYGKLKGAFVVRRDGYGFQKTEIKAKVKKAEQRERKDSEDMDTILALIRKNPGRSQQGLVRDAGKLSQPISVKRCRDALCHLEAAGKVSMQEGPRNAKLYSPFEIGEVEQEAMGDDAP